MKSKKIIASLLAVTLLAGMASGLTACSSNEKASTEEKKVLKIGMECAYAPFNWTQTTDENGALPIAETGGYANGYDIMVSKMISEELGYEVEIYKTEWDSLILSVNSGKIDAVVAGMAMTEERKQSVDFTDTYYVADIVAVTMKGSKYENAKSLNDLTGASVTSQVATIWYDTIEDQLQNADIKPPVDSTPSTITTLTSGKTDIIVIDMPTALAAQMANPDMVILDLAEGDFDTSSEDTDFGIAVKKGNTELVEELNKVVSKLTDAKKEELMKKALEIQPLS
ncbi:transporter substrate-binding domain-containing protein [Sedimentibacter sp. B4]|uniref:transporter substrate-binding domain-containing protein n=1 Tax=Sedimentibacter sp. B4 TaxID=304766 RepID=UPI0002F5C4D8|nr:transporter substrate-binding domain-containing protein [Sedimentibacter sp. B4]